MYRLKILALIFILLLAGCSISPSPTLNLSSPANGSPVISLSPTLTWGSLAGATYRLLVAKDSNFQDIVVDANNLRDTSYEIPSGKLGSNTWYYWKVLAKKGNTASNWTPDWSFQTPSNVTPGNIGTIRVEATVDGKPWNGTLSYQISGPFSDTDNSVPWEFTEVQAGTYTITFSYGGPKGATLTNITPASSQELTGGGTIKFTLNFNTQASSTITVNATLNGAQWTGNLSYAVSGPVQNSENTVPQSISNLPSGSYTMTYKGGGPSGAVLTGISPAAVQNLPDNGSIQYTLNFSSSQSSQLSITALLNGTNWSGPVQYSISGPVSGSYNQLPMTLNNTPAGTYTITYQGGGPQGATLGGIMPGNTINLSNGRSGGFVLNFYTQQTTGSIGIKATLNGQPWSGIVHYSIGGPSSFIDQQVPRTYNNLPTGKYNITYTGGGPAGASLVGITPNFMQTLKGGATIVFTLNFAQQPSTGTISVNALLDGQPWKTMVGSGSISYSLSGPSPDSGNTIPGLYPNMPAGNYTLNYNSGGPIGATLTGISPAPTINLPPGGSVNFTLNFTGQPKGTVTVQASLNGEPWSGSVSYVLQGPYVESGGSAPRTFSNAPQGEYTVQYRAGGPPQSKFVGVTPSSQGLAPGGAIMFTIMFEFQGGILPHPPVPKPAPEPEPGPIGPLLEPGQEK
jgi:hypothetical protein